MATDTTPSAPGGALRRSRAGDTPGSLLRAGALGLALAALASAADAQEIVRIGIPNVATDVGFFLADRNGYFEEEGIAVEFSSFPSAANMIAPLGGGQLDVGGGAISAGFFNAVRSGIGIRIVADKGSITEQYEYSTLVIRKDHVDSGRFTTLADLAGMTIAAAAQGANSESQINQALLQAGLSYDDVNVVYLAYPEMYTALSNQAIDAAINNEPTISRMVRDGVAVRASETALFPGYQTAVVMYSENFAEQRRDVAEAFMRAYLRAIRDYNDALGEGGFTGPNADAVIAALTEYTAITDPEIYRAMTPFVVDPDGALGVDSLAADLEFFQSRGLVPGDVTIDPYIDTSFTEQAVADLGPYTPSE